MNGWPSRNEAKDVDFCKRESVASYLYDTPSQEPRLSAPTRSNFDNVYSYSMIQPWFENGHAIGSHLG